MRPVSADKVKSMPVIHMHCMGDTKRGRERKGLTKREQRREQEIERAVETRDEELDFDELYNEDEFEL
jgi:hypothetical protein